MSKSPKMISIYNDVPERKKKKEDTTQFYLALEN